MEVKCTLIDNLLPNQILLLHICGHLKWFWISSRWPPNSIDSIVMGLINESKHCLVVSLYFIRFYQRIEACFFLGVNVTHLGVMPNTDNALLYLFKQGENTMWFAFMAWLQPLKDSVLVMIRYDKTVCLLFCPVQREGPDDFCKVKRRMYLSYPPSPFRFAS